MPISDFNYLHLTVTHSIAQVVTEQPHCIESVFRQLLLRSGATMCVSRTECSFVCPLGRCVSLFVRERLVLLRRLFAGNKLWYFVFEVRPRGCPSLPFHNRSKTPLFPPPALLLSSLQPEQSS